MVSRTHGTQVPFHVQQVAVCAGLSPCPVLRPWSAGPSAQECHTAPPEDSSVISLVARWFEAPDGSALAGVSSQFQFFALYFHVNFDSICQLPQDYLLGF